MQANCSLGYVLSHASHSHKGAGRGVRAWGVKTRGPRRAVVLEHIHTCHARTLTTACNSCTCMAHMIAHCYSLSRAHTHSHIGTGCEVGAGGARGPRPTLLIFNNRTYNTTHIRSLTSCRLVALYSTHDCSLLLAPSRAHTHTQPHRLWMRSPSVLCKRPSTDNSRT